MRGDLSEQQFGGTLMNLNTNILESKTMPDIENTVVIEPTLDILIYTRNMGHYRQKPTSGLFSFIKPYRNIETVTPYDAKLFKVDLETPQRMHQHFLYHRDDFGVPDPEYSSDASEVETGDDYDPAGESTVQQTDTELETDTEEEAFQEFDGDWEDRLNGDRDYGVARKNQITGDSVGTLGNFGLKQDLQSGILGDAETDFVEYNYDQNYLVKKGARRGVPNYFSNGKSDFQLKNEYRKYQRKDSALKYTRNWFLSNHIVDDWANYQAYTGGWIDFSDFEVDRHRSYQRDVKHGSNYRLNFNTELWWTRHETPDYGIRRLDGLEFDEHLGALDSDGEIGHLHKGLLDVAMLPENSEILETTLPLFERSIIDPESPALNEDGEFPENDLNLVYSTYDINTLKVFQLKKNIINTTNLRAKVKNFISRGVPKKQKPLSLGSAPKTLHLSAEGSFNADNINTYLAGKRTQKSSLSENTQGIFKKLSSNNKNNLKNR